MGHRKQAHLAAPPGKRVLVILKDKTRFVAKFRSTEKHQTFFDDHESVLIKDIGSMTIFRETNRK